MQPKSTEKSKIRFSDRAYKLKVNCCPINLNETWSSSLSTQANWQSSEWMHGQAEPWRACCAWNQNKLNLQIWQMSSSNLNPLKSVYSLSHSLRVLRQLHYSSLEELLLLLLKRLFYLHNLWSMDKRQAYSVIWRRTCPYRFLSRYYVTE